MPAGKKAKKGEKFTKRPSGGLWLYGVHPVLAALANPARRYHRLVLAGGLAGGHESDLEARITEAAEKAGFELKQLEIKDKREIDGLLPGSAVHQGAALQVDPLPDLAIEDVASPGEVAGSDGAGPIIVLDQATDPRNVGAVLRSAAAFGARAVIVQDRRSPEETGALAKAASGALETVPLVRVTNIARALEWLKKCGFWCLGLEAGAEPSLADAAPEGPCVLVLGSEGAGLRRLTRENCDLLAHIPIRDTVESLNLSTAAAIALYELARKGA